MGSLRTTAAREAAAMGRVAARSGHPNGQFRKALGVDPDIKKANGIRLRRIEGQIRGLEKMVQEDRYCPDIIVQIASVQEALRGVARNLMKNHLHHCAGEAQRNGKLQDREAIYEELLELIYKHLR